MNPPSANDTPWYSAQVTSPQSGATVINPLNTPSPAPPKCSDTRQWACRRGSRVAPAPLESAQKVQAAVQARQQREAQLALQRRTLTGANASTSGALLLHPLLAAVLNSLNVDCTECSAEEAQEMW